MPYRNQNHKTRNQRQHRRAGHVRRIEVVLSAESERDHAISEFLDDLPHGEASEFVRQAIAEKMAREAAPEPEIHASDQIELLFAELDHQRREANAQIEALYQELADEKRRAGQHMESMISELAELRHAMRQPASIHEPDIAPPPPTLPETQEMVTSSGLDMSRPRRKTAKNAAPPPTLPEEPEEPEELTEADKIRLAQIMAQSIRRAQPGRG